MNNLDRAAYFKSLMARLDKSMSYIIKETINHGEHGWVPMEGK